MTKKYDKLVRDHIPEIVRENGRVPVVSRLTGSALAERLFDKLEEEHRELLEGKNVEEIIDLLEVLLALARTYGYSEKQTLELMREKRATRGGFEEGYLLSEVR